MSAKSEAAPVGGETIDHPLSPWGMDDADPLAEERLAAVGRLAAGISHELSNQVAVLGGLVDDLVLAAAAGRTLDLAGASALRHVHGRMKELCLGMRDLVRGRPLTVLGRSDAGAVVAGLLRVLERVGLTRQLAVTVRVPDEPVAVPLQPYALEQVLLNFVLNATAALDRDAVEHVWVTVTAGATWVEVEVRDDGPGLPDAAARALFDCARTTRPGGTGLGLQMARRFAREAGGDTWARRPAEGGLAVGLRLPRIP